MKWCHRHSVLQKLHPNTEFWILPGYVKKIVSQITDELNTSNGSVSLSVVSFILSLVCVIFHKGVQIVVFTTFSLVEVDFDVSLQSNVSKVSEVSAWCWRWSLQWVSPFQTDYRIRGEGVVFSFNFSYFIFDLFFVKRLYT